MRRVESYTAASVFPVKLFHNEIIDGRGRIIPRHLQVNPTNACNLNCKFCSCRDRDRGVAMPWDEMRACLGQFAGLGTQALTITGGGEPLLYSRINDLIAAATRYGMEVGLVTNGTVMERLEAGGLRWARISFSDTREWDPKALSRAVTRHSSVDWAFSYVLTSAPDPEKLRRVVTFAGEHGFTHVRIVSDLLDLDNVPEMRVVRGWLRGSPGEELVVYQGRKEFARGRGRCLISLLKPVIGADGGVWPCCGAQYALEDPTLDYEKRMRMGDWRAFPERYLMQQPFDGSICAKCYYDEYNLALGLMVDKPEHVEFV